MPNHTTRLHFSPDSKQLVVGLSDCSLNLWDVDSMAHLSIATEKKGLFIDAAFISNTAELAYCVAGTTTTTTHIMIAVSGECEKAMAELAGISIDTLSLTRHAWWPSTMHILLLLRHTNSISADLRAYHTIPVSRSTRCPPSYN